MIMTYHKATQARYYENHKKLINKKRAEYQKRCRLLAKLAKDAGLDKKIDLK